MINAQSLLSMYTLASVVRSAVSFRAGGLRSSVAMADGQNSLVHTTALAIVPPEGPCWVPIQAARERLRDGGLFRWPPHINVLYPFVEPVYFERFATAVAPALRECAPFRVQLDRYGVFGTERRGVVWMEPTAVRVPSSPDSSPPFAELYERIYSMVPDMPRPARPFVPHLTITHTDSLARAQALADELQAEADPDADPIEFEVGELLILSRSSSTHPFRVAFRLPLGEHAHTFGADSRAFESMPRSGSLDWHPRERESLHARIQARSRSEADKGAS
jgi:poly(A) polymerase